tara:strand:+ start:5036 stop:5476 length:441 start_codon:yes stop_codon:yes gene_type:complete
MKNKKVIIAGVIDMGFKFVGLGLTFAVGLLVLAFMFILISEIAIQIRYGTDLKTIGAVCVWGANGLGLFAVSMLAYLIFEESKMIIEEFTTSIKDSVKAPTLPVPVYGNCVNHRMFGSIDIPVSTIASEPTVPVNTFYVSGTITQS